MSSKAKAASAGGVTRIAHASKTGRQTEPQNKTAPVTPATSDPWITRQQIAADLGLSLSATYKLGLPAPIVFTEKLVRWPLSVFTAWKAEKAATLTGKVVGVGTTTGARALRSDLQHI